MFFTGIDGSEEYVCLGVVGVSGVRGGCLLYYVWLFFLNLLVS